MKLKVVPVLFKLDGWYFGNLLFGGIIGMLIVDPATGAMWKIEDKFLSKSATSTIEPEMQILIKNEIPPSWEKHLIKIN